MLLQAVLLALLLTHSPIVRAIESDITGPSLGPFQVSASTVDVTNAAATIYVDMRVTDQSGVVGGSTGAVYLQLNPPLRQILEFPSLYSGTSTDGVWRYTFVVPARSLPGTWQLFGNQWSDIAGNYSTNPNSASVEVVNTGPPQDITGPSLGPFQVSASTVDVTNAAATIYVDMRVTDQSGVVGGSTGAVYLQLNPPLRQILEFPSLYSGTSTDGVWRYTFVVPARSLPGTWQLFGNQWSDIAGNYSTNPNSASVEVVNLNPAEPQNLAATSIAATSLTLTWGLPSSDGGSPITDYKIEVSSNGGSTWTAITHTASDSRTFNVTGLAKGTSYRFRVSTVTGVGTSAPTTVLSATTLGNSPSVPNALKAVATTTSITLTWTKALVTNGSAVRNYIVEYSTNRGRTWIAIKRSASVSLSVTITGLRRKSTYSFRIKALNDVGASGYSKAVTITTK